MRDKAHAHKLTGRKKREQQPQTRKQASSVCESLEMMMMKRRHLRFLITVWRGRSATKAVAANSPIYDLDVEKQII